MDMIGSTYKGDEIERDQYNDILDIYHNNNGDHILYV